MKRLPGLLTIILFILSNSSFGQQAIFDLMDRRDLKLEDVELQAEQIFKVTGTGKGTGYKQFQRWLYEQRFHLDNNGYIILPEQELMDYNLALLSMGVVSSTTKAASGIWTELGPSGWNKTSGWNPGTGRLSAIAVNPADQNVIYVGSPGGGIWKTINGGSSWSPLSEYNSVWMYIYSIAIDPLNSNIVYAGTGNSGNQVIKSTDAGLTWSLLGSGPTGTIRKILIHPTTTNIVFACASNGIWRSTNSGTSWTQVQSVTKEDIEFKPGNTSIMYASGSSEVVRSIDGGLTWTVLGSSVGITNTGRTLVAVTPANPDYVYVCQASGSVFGRIYKSVNSGVSFTTTVTGSSTTGTNYFGYEPDGTGTSGQAGHDMALCVSPVNAEEVHIAGIICWKSLNGGTSFTATTDWSLPNSIGYNHADVHGLEFVGSTMYSISDGGVYRSLNNADDWTDLSSGLGIRQFYRIASSPTNPTVITGGAQDNGSVARQASGTWVDWLGADGMEGLVSPTNHLNIWGTSQNGQLYRSTNGGSSYSGLAAISGGGWVTPIAIHPSNQTIIFAGGNAVYKSTNSGSTFTSISGTTISNTLVDLAVAPSDPNYIYASYSNQLYVTTNGGTTWATYTAPGTITDICVSPGIPSKLWITTSSGTGRVHVSTNSGATFTNISGALPTLSARSVVVDNSTDEKIYVGMSLGVYTYNNSNPVWTPMTDNLPLVSINELDLQVSANKLYVATYGRGVWETSLVSSGCNAPPSIAATGITLTSANLNWGTVSGAISYTLEYKQASSSTWIVLAASTTATSYSLSSLTQGTTYDFRVKTNCTSISSYYSTSQFTTLAPVPACITSLEPNETQATAIAVNTNITISAGIASATDIDYYSFTTTTYANLNITLGNLPFDYDIDLRNSAGTVLASGTNGGTNSELMTLSSQAPGTYYIRIYGYAGAYSDAQCYNLYIGSVSTSSCVTPGGLTTGSVSGTGAVLSWTAVAGASEYEVRYRPSGTINWTNTVLLTANSYTVSGLAYNTMHDWQVRSRCSGDSSAYSNSVVFTTLPNCPPGIPGTSMSSPIVVGPAPCSGNPYAHTATNSTTNCFSNNYTGSNNQASPNIWYQFTLNAAATIEVGHCGSALNDTYIHLLDSTGANIASNDDNGPICTGLKASISTALNAGTYYVVSEGYGTTVGSILTTIKRSDSCSTKLNANLLLEGYYLGGGLMEPVMTNQAFSGSPAPAANDVDDVTLELRNTTPPYTVVATATTRLKTNGDASFTFPPMSGSYYLSVLHRNTLGTWSKNPVTLSVGTINYSFSDGANKAYGDNLKQVGPGKWALYSGELAVDDNIDLFDLSPIQSDILLFAGGYLSTDLTGDGNVDLLDSQVVENHINAFIYSAHP